MPRPPRGRRALIPTSEEWRTPGGTGMVVGDRRLLKKGQTHPPPGSHRRPWSPSQLGTSGESGTLHWASRLMGCSPDDGRLSRTSRICPPAPPTRGGCSTTRRRRPFCLHSRRARSSAQDSWRTRRQSTKGTEECTSRGSEGLFGSGLTQTCQGRIEQLQMPWRRRSCGRYGRGWRCSARTTSWPSCPRSSGRSSSRRPWSSERWSGRHYLCEPGVLDDAFCEDEMVDGCVVCLSRQKDAVILPCRHLVVCADRIEHCCPYCRGKADEALVVEYPEWPDA
ncbi:RING finger domain-containing protein [Giardia muris]|uniref:RING finger domain-containing protein n=1 Tax=Giardia muris TaxID=5742 RepID=A0A4Z1T6C4_GIAMU|nr:RING finger domain-containing protein [Giardia muris]|eukprot:TNJ29613.1 RING finger domain-containing protein [Giardia muris]